MQFLWRHRLTIEAWLLGGLMLVALAGPLFATNSDPLKPEAQAELDKLNRSKATYNAWLDCGWEAMKHTGADFATPADEAATAAVDGCLEESAAARRAIEAMFWENSDRDARTEQLHEQLRRDMVRAFASEIVKARSRMRARAAGH